MIIKNKGIRLIKSMRTKRSIKSTDKLLIKSVELTPEHLKVVIYHWDNKWLENIGSWSDNTHWGYDFGTTDNDMFTLIIPNTFIEKHNIDYFAFHRRDKYESELLFTIKPQRDGSSMIKNG